ncbi:MAG: histidine phosphatase family protein [Candidatus Diapherotrites archaeon]|nr:histidine phosphatase family protein [Candidatus Diapherotrites archaeon]
MKIYLIRHGETTGDVEERYGGNYDDHLTEKGIAQSEQLAKKLSKSGIQIIFSSPLFRAKETAQILKKCLKCDLRIVGGIRERNKYGIMAGMKKSEAKLKYPEQVKLLEDFRKTAKGAETYSHLKKRVIRAFRKIAGSKYDVIAIFTHAGPIRCIVREVVKAGELKYVGDCAVFELEREGRKFSLLNSDNAIFE